MEEINRMCDKCGKGLNYYGENNVLGYFELDINAKNIDLQKIEHWEDAIIGTEKMKKHLCRKCYQDFCKEY